VIILTRIKFHTIFYAFRSLLDKYCEKEKCNYKYAENYKNGMALHGCVFPFQPKVLSHRWRDGWMDVVSA